MKLPQIILLSDDAVVLALVCLIGIRFHQTDPSLLSRLPYTLLPFLAAWVFFAAACRLYDTKIASAWNQLWRVPIVAALAAPAGAAIRAAWLQVPFIPIFAIIMGVALAAGLLISRSIFILVFGKRWSTPDNG